MRLQYKGIPVRRSWFSAIPILKSARGIALFGTIYLRRDLYRKYQSKKHDPETLSVLAHELTHVRRAKNKGVFLWHLQYWLSKSTRLEEELKATAQEMRTLKQNGEEFDIDKRSKHFSSVNYLWMTSYTEARRKLKKLWDSV